MIKLATVANCALVRLELAEVCIVKDERNRPFIPLLEVEASSWVSRGRKSKPFCVRVFLKSDPDRNRALARRMPLSHLKNVG